MVSAEIAMLSNMIKRQMPQHDDSISHEGSMERPAHHRMTHMQGRIIHYIHHEQKKEDVFQRDIEKAFSIRRSTATNILQLMEQNELIRREAVPYDARLKKIILTEKSYACHFEIRKKMEEIEKRLQKDIPLEELDIFRKVLEKMKRNLDPRCDSGDDI